MGSVVSTKRSVSPTLVLSGRAALAYVDDVALIVTVVEKWTDADTIKMLEESNRIGGGQTAPGAIVHCFGETLGAAANQRKMIVDWMAKNDIEPTPRTITITDSVLMRAALVAYSWLTKTETKAFKTNELDQACAWITAGLLASPEAVKAAMLGCYRLVKRLPNTEK